MQPWACQRGGSPQSFTKLPKRLASKLVLSEVQIKTGQLGAKTDSFPELSQGRIGDLVSCEIQIQTIKPDAFPDSFPKFSKGLAGDHVTAQVYSHFGQRSAISHPNPELAQRRICDPIV
mmetsp:Transcript_114915/g.263855  ORF Transcript_114915/g.263855 Transcript_114915/m.263855 type:complete len:119 (+) Transcript_114915:800-1156(+)